jgi:hypothetical protein
MTGSQYQANSTYNLDTILSDEFVPLEVTRFARTPASFNITSPNMTGTAPARVSRNSFTLRWSGSGGDKVVIMALMYNAAGDAIEQEVTCVVADDGEFTIPSTSWSGFTSGRYIQVVVQRMLEDGGLVEYNNSESRVVGSYANVGLVQAQ